MIGPQAHLGTAVFSNRPLFVYSLLIDSPLQACYNVPNHHIHMINQSNCNG